MKNIQGFTIVELLIVVVVIAILSAVSVTAYSSISGKANVSRKLSDVAQIQKQLELYKVDYGDDYNPYPGFSDLYAPGGAPKGFDKLSLPDDIKSRLTACMTSEGVSWDKCTYGDASNISRDGYVLLSQHQEAYFIAIWHDIDRVWRVVRQSDRWTYSGDACGGKGNLCSWSDEDGAWVPCTSINPSDPECHPG